MDCSTTDVNSESGQSLLEFAFILPVLVGMVVILIRINSAIQVSIVNQQYSRAHALFLTFNSSIYPQIEFQIKHLISKQMNQMVIGVSQNTGAGENQDYVPEATIQLVTRSKTVKGSDAPQEGDVTSRSRVRVRNTVTLCTPPLYLPSPGAAVRDIAITAVPQYVTAHHLLNNSKFSFCGSTISYE